MRSSSVVHVDVGGEGHKVLVSQFVLCFLLDEFREDSESGLLIPEFKVGVTDVDCEDGTGARD